MTRSSRPINRVFRVALALVLVLGLASAHADVDAATEDLKTCVSRHLDNERSNSNPKARNLLNICKKELDALLGLLPVGTEGEIEQLILSDIEDQLAES